MAQYNKVSEEFAPNGKSLFEVSMLADQNGDIISLENPLPVISASMPLPSQFVTLNNFEDDDNRGWDVEDEFTPVFGIRVKPTSNTSFKLINFNITLNGGTSVVMGYQWHMNATLANSYTWSEIGSTGVEYVKFNDVDGTPNQITSDTEVHSKTLVGKSTSDLTEEMKTFPFTPGGIEMFLEIRRLDGAAKQDLWYDLTFALD